VREDKEAPEEIIQQIKKQAGKAATALNQGTWEEVYDESMKLYDITKHLVERVAEERDAEEDELEEDED